jgi:hypothetical protein
MVRHHEPHLHVRHLMVTFDPIGWAPHFDHLQLGDDHGDQPEVGKVLERAMG